MIELFAYFFLSLYRTSLQKIKYFQNELTNIEAKQIALRAALSYGEQCDLYESGLNEARSQIVQPELHRELFQSIAPFQGDYFSL